MDEYKYPEDMLVEEEDSPYVEEIAPTKWSYEMFSPVLFLNHMLEFLENYGWYVLFASIAMVYVGDKLLQYYKKLMQQKEDAEYHKDPDKALARMEAIQRAREEQQRRLEEASRRAREEQQEREERKRAEALERLEKYGSAAGQRLGALDDDNMPLSRGHSSSSYRPPKRSKCGGGGCGR